MNTEPPQQPGVWSADELSVRMEELLGDRIQQAELIAESLGGLRYTWWVQTRSGGRYAVKWTRDRSRSTREGHTSVETEWAALTLLADLGAAVPRPVGVDPEAGLLATRWVEGPTLDDLAQEDPTAAGAVVPELIRELDRIGRVLETHLADLEPHTFAMDYDAYLGEDFQELLTQAQSGFQRLAEEAGQLDVGWETLLDSWEAVAEAIFRSVPRYGSLDYTARNVLVADYGPVVLDFSTLGWDWAERRLVQYAVPLGARHVAGNFVSLLTPERLESCRESWFFQPDALESHHFVFLCLIAERLLRNGVDAPSAAEAERNPAFWQNRRQRFQRLVDLFVDGAVWEFPPTQRLRRCVAEWFWRSD